MKYDLMCLHFSLPTALVSSPNMFPSQIHFSSPSVFFFINNPLSLIFAASVCMTMTNQCGIRNLPAAILKKE